MPRPCPFVRCRYHLAHDTHVGIYERRPVVSRVDPHPERLEESCALDVADRVSARELSLESIAELAGLDVETARAALASATARQRIQRDEEEEVA